MKKLVFVFSVLLSLLAPHKGYTQVWHRIANPFDVSATFNDIWFFSDTEGIAVGSFGSAFRTTNAGQSWTAFFPSSCSQCIINYSRVLFFSPNEGYIWSQVSALRDTALLLKSTDRGVTWNSISEPNPPFENESTRLHYFGSLNLAFDGAVSWIQGSGDPPRVRIDVSRSRDMGASWSSILSDSISCDPPEGGVYFGDSLNYLIFYNYYQTGSVEVTTNGGIDWKIIESPYHQKYFYGNHDAAYLGNREWLLTFNDSLTLYLLKNATNTEPISTVSSPIDRLFSHEEMVFATLRDSLHPSEVLVSSDRGLHWSHEMTDTIVKSSTIGSIRWISPNASYAIGWRSLPDIFVLMRNVRNSVPQSQHSSSVSFYPNPANTELHLVDAANYILTDVLGRKIDFKSNGDDLDCTDLEDGVYFIKGTSTAKLIVSHHR